MDQPVLSWGRTCRYTHEVRSLGRLGQTRTALFAGGKSTIFRGYGRSYGDVALNADGGLCQTRNSDNLLEFDQANGCVKAQSGMSIADLNAITIPAGWIVPVSPGTQFVTLGGAVANDVHGKNHHVDGSFGAHIMALKLIRSDGEELICSREKNMEMFNATISGLGLTGYIAWVALQLKPIASSNMQVETIHYSSLEAFFEISDESMDWPYSAAWVDCFSPLNALGRGIFTRARFLGEGELRAPQQTARLSIYRELPSMLLNKYTISAFNWLYMRRNGAQTLDRVAFHKVFYPLDSIAHWNRIYGRAGFFQHQSIIPMATSAPGVSELLRTIKASGQGSFLAVLKRHGPETSPGLNSFPLQGISLALDFPNRGAKTLKLLQALDDIAVAYGGRMYPAKDATMSPETYQSGYPNWTRLEALRDPNINSSFWRRVTQQND